MLEQVYLLRGVLKTCVSEFWDFPKKKNFRAPLREGVKYYFADFVRKGVEGVPPKSVTYFMDQIQMFFEQKTQFLALFEEKFPGKSP